MKVVINMSQGDIKLSHVAIMRLSHLKGLRLIPYTLAFDEAKGYFLEHWVPYDGHSKTYQIRYISADAPIPQVSTLDTFSFNVTNLKRDDLDLITVVEETGPTPYARGSDLRVVQIPDDVEWAIVNYEGNEAVVMSNSGFDWPAEESE